MYPQSMFGAKIKKTHNIFHLKMIVSTALKNCFILHERVFVMSILASTSLIRECTVLLLSAYTFRYHFSAMLRLTRQAINPISTVYTHCVLQKLL